MDDFFFVVPLAIMLAIVAAVAYGVVSLTRRRRDFAEVDPGIGTVKQLYFYGVSFVALLMAANGVTLVIAYVLDSLFGGPVISPSGEMLFWGLALTLVGLPLWGFHWWVIRKYVRDLPVETRSVVRKVYTYFVLGVGVGFWVFSGAEVLRWLFGVGSVGQFDGYTWAALPIWGVLWVYHWRYEAEEGQPTPETMAPRRLYLYIWSGAALVMAASSLALILHALLGEVYDGLHSGSAVAGRGLDSVPLRQWLAFLLVGAPVWAVHWLVFARDDLDSTLRQVYTYPFAILGGVVTVLVSAGLVIYRFLEWHIGVSEFDSATVQFRVIAGAGASIIVGGGVLVYHWLEARREAAGPALEPQTASRAYPYALAAVGLVTLVVGATILVQASVGVLGDVGRTAVAGRELWKNAVSAGLTMIVLGGPLWGYYWWDIQRQVGADGLEERSGLPRRLLIFAALGVGMLALLGSFTHLAYVFFREVAEGNLSVVLRDAKVSIGIILPVAVFLPYYWMVYREDRRIISEAGGVEALPERKAVTLLLAEGGGELLSGLEKALGYAITPLRSADPDIVVPELSETDLPELVLRIGEAPGMNVLLVPDGATLRVLSYR